MGVARRERETIYIPHYNNFPHRLRCILNDVSILKANEKYIMYSNCRPKPAVEK